MAIEEIEKMLNEMEIEYRFHHFEESETIEPPFLVYLIPETENFYADGKIYFSRQVLDLELYTGNKDPILEKRIEKILDKHEMVYSKINEWIESENLYEVIYEMEV